MTKETKTATAFSDLLQSIQRDVEGKIDKTVSERIPELKEIISKYGTLNVKIGDKTKPITGLKHKQLEDLIRLVAQRMPILMVGMAGTGKTHAAEQAAEAMDLPFYAISVGDQTSKSDILGYMNATGSYVRSMFREAYENGGVFLMDEIDAGNANVLITINSALSQQQCAFPDGMVNRHKDFIFIASANTFGNGANRQYVGRNQLDAATLDRFAIIEWLVDDDLEQALAGLDDKGQKWYQVVKQTREEVEKQGMRVLITPRSTQRGAILLAAGAKIDDVLEYALMNSVPQDKQEKLRKFAKDVWKKAKVDKDLGKEYEPIDLDEALPF